jgi:hypothetical protein
VVLAQPWAGQVRLVEELGGKWAVGADYGISIVRDYLNGLLATPSLPPVEPPLPPEIPEPEPPEIPGPEPPQVPEPEPPEVPEPELPEIPEPEPGPGPPAPEPGGGFLFGILMRLAVFFSELFKRLTGKVKG